MTHAQTQLLASFLSPLAADSMRELEELKIRANHIVKCRPDLTQSQIIDHVVVLSSGSDDRNYWMRICVDRALAAAPMPWEAGFVRLQGLEGLSNQKLSADELNRLL